MPKMNYFRSLQQATDMIKRAKVIREMIKAQASKRGGIEIGDRVYFTRQVPVKEHIVHEHMRTILSHKTT